MATDTTNRQFVDLAQPEIQKVVARMRADPRTPAGYVTQFRERFLKAIDDIGLLAGRHCPVPGELPAYWRGAIHIFLLAENRAWLATVSQP